MIETAAARSLYAYADWIQTRALPFWFTHGFNKERGAFHERLALDGTPINVPLRSMVQARQIYVFADAARQGWFPDGEVLASCAMENLLRTYGRQESEGLSFAFAADANGVITSEVRDSYAHAFILFALASLFRLSGDKRLLEFADQTIRFLKLRMYDHDNGGLHNSLPLSESEKRQNPHMHLLESFIFLEEAAPGRGYLEEARDIVRLFQTRMFHRTSDCLPEYFQTDWQNSPGQRGTVWEPGHHFEWYWLLAQFERLSGERIDAAALYLNAIEHGLSAAGLIWDEVALDDMRVLKRSTRLWPHTEAIKAALQAHRNHVAGATAFAGRMAETLLTTFLDVPFKGGWIDHSAEDGTALVDYVPASSLYHLYLAATQVPETPAATSPHS